MPVKRFVKDELLRRGIIYNFFFFWKGKRRGRKFQSYQTGRGWCHDTAVLFPRSPVLKYLTAKLPIHFLVFLLPPKFSFVSLLNFFPRMLLPLFFLPSSSFAIASFKLTPSKFRNLKANYLYGREWKSFAFKNVTCKGKKFRLMLHFALGQIFCSGFCFSEIQL